MSTKSAARAARRRLRRRVRKCDADDARGLSLPVPTQTISNEEFAPPPQTEEQRRVEHRLTEPADPTWTWGRPSG